jgi:predicted metal-dependent phosphoesterase TrpH
MRCDLHVHSKHSGAANLPLLRHLSRESYSEPVDVFRTARRRGMDLVTITDHDTIEGVLEIAHLPEVFVSEEVTCRLPTGTKLHLGVFDIDERDHPRFQALSDDAEALFAYLAERGLPFCVNHPFSPLTGRREAADLPFAFERGRAVETLNGMMPRTSNDHAGAAARAAARPAVGGSDAHTLASVARAFTEVPGARSRVEFVAGLRAGLTLPRGRAGSYARLTGDVAAVFVGALRANAAVAGRSLPDLGRFAGVAALAPVMLLMPVITAVNYARERTMADVHHRRYQASLTARAHDPKARPVGAGEVA